MLASYAATSSPLLPPALDEVEDEEGKDGCEEESGGSGASFDRSLRDLNHSSAAAEIGYPMNITAVPRRYSFTCRVMAI